MATREPYDQERIVRHTEVHDDPTAVLPEAEVVRRHDAYADGAVIVERPAVVARAIHEPASYDAAAVREDISIDHVVERRALLDRVSQVIWFVAGVLETLIGLRIVFRLLEANTASGFVRFIYDATEPFVRPFQGMFTDPASDGAVLDSAAVVAMIIYALVTWGIVRLIWLLFDRAETGTSRSVSHLRHDGL
jgi:hypothetical protein